MLTKLVQFSCHDFDHHQKNGRTKLFLVKPTDKMTQYQKSIYSPQPGLIDIPFKLSDDGHLYVAKRLDRETNGAYEIVLMCQDYGVDTRLNKTLNIQIKLNDINDNCPRSLVPQNLDKDMSLFLNRDTLLEQQLNRSLFGLNYTDADIGENGQLKFELMNHRDIFGLEENVNGNIFNLQIRLNDTTQLGRKKFIEQLKLGHYLIKVKIRDNGFPSCIKTDAFRLYLGNNELRTRSELVKHLEEVFKQPDNAIISYINERKDLEIHQDLLTTTNNIRIAHVSSYDRQNVSNYDRGLLKLFTKDDYVILLSLIALLILASSFLSIVGCVYFFKNSSDDRRFKKTGNKEVLKVRNYCEVVANDSSVNTSNSHEDDDHSQTEINQLLKHDAVLNRYSVSLTSSDPTQSQSADSVLSSVTYTRDLTSSNSSQNSSDECLRPKSHVYEAGFKKQHSTFLVQKYNGASGSSFKPNNYSPVKVSFSYK